MTKNVLVCIPTYNEALNVGILIEEVRKLGLDMVICDGHSSDQTVEIALEKGAQVIYRDGFGKGTAITKALTYGQEHGYEKLVTIDCDLTYQASEIPMLLKYIHEYDMVVGSRNLKDISFLRRMANMLMNFWTNLLFASSVSDMATGMRVIDIMKFKPYLSAQSFDIEPQIYAVALRERMRIREVSISYHKRSGVSKIRLYHLFIICWRLFKERFFHK